MNNKSDIMEKIVISRFQNFTFRIFIFSLKYHIKNAIDKLAWEFGQINDDYVFYVCLQ